ncbi:MAG: Gfo/Idh/MocA family oxidoreductase [Betaproteobacteria bacterium]|nr:MAG: Gfo/Idh/MocA family oxidoreductase [Betaproteobacteria bacterium]
MKVGIIGCGLIGQKRAKALAGARLVACADMEKGRAERLAQSVDGCTAIADWRALVRRDDVELAVVATPHDVLAEMTAQAVKAGKHVLVEKPAARHVSELEPLLSAVKKARVLVRVGFNHRYHRSFRQARKIVDSGALGPLMFLRARYGHGGRIGYDREWRAQPRISGGGELIDQGMHLIDLARWFLGDFAEVDGYAHTYFWDMPVDDNAFLLLKTPEKKIAFLHASCTEWKNTFSFELYGRDGKLQIDGLGGSYGVERLAWYKMLPQMGPPETTIWEYPMADDSWDVEMKEFLEDIRLDRQPAANLEDAAAALRIVDQVYRSSGFDHRA